MSRIVLAPTRYRSCCTRKSSVAAATLDAVMSSLANAVCNAASCWVNCATTARRASSAFDCATSRATFALTTDFSRWKLLNNVQLTRNPTFQPLPYVLVVTQGASWPENELESEALKEGQYAALATASCAPAARACASACKTCGAVSCTAARRPDVSGSGGRALSGTARTAWATPICRPRLASAVARSACACSSAS